MLALGKAQLTARRKRRQDFAAFSQLVASPAALPFTLPANAELLMSTSSALAAADELLTVNGRAYSAPAQAANVQRVVGFAGRSSAVAKAAGAPGTVRVYVRDPAGVPRLVAQG